MMLGQLATCIMIFNEGDSSGGPHAHEAGGAPLPIHQPPVLTPPHCLLQNACNTHTQTQMLRGFVC